MILSNSGNVEESSMVRIQYWAIRVGGIKQGQGLEWIS